MTEKLFYTDSHMTTFSAQVMACEQSGEFYEVVLSRTAFFPTGGGQYADTGMLGNVAVLDVQERDGIIYHKTNGALTVGDVVEGSIDWEERFSKMQQHSGEHIVSGLVHKKYGYDNVGFHMGKDAITMDFNGVLTNEQLREIEWEANQVVVQNLPIQVLYPKRTELKQMEYRSKIEIEGQVRIVEIPGCDRCACCAPHVNLTGEIGLIRLLGVQNYKGGVRVSMLCGFRALEDYREKADSTKHISVLLSAKECEITEEVSRLKEELAQKKAVIANLQQEILHERVRSVANNQPMVVTFENLEGNGPREMMNLLVEKGTSVAAVFAGNDRDGYRYVIGSRTKDVRPLAQCINEAFSGRGGGKPEMVQGSVAGNAETIRKEVEEWVSRN